jgi:hypothetical protein
MYLEIIVQIFVIKGDCYKCDCYECDCYKCELLHLCCRPGYKLVIINMMTNN